MENLIRQASRIIPNRKKLRGETRQQNTYTLDVNGESIELLIGIDSSDEQNTLPIVQTNLCVYTIIRGSFQKNYTSNNTYCYQYKPKISLVKTVIQTETKMPFILNQIFVDGDKINIDNLSLDLMFYIECLKLNENREDDFLNYINNFHSSFKENKWYSSGYLNRLISESKWNSLKNKVAFNAIGYNDVLNYLESKEFLEYGFLPMIQGFKLKYAESSKEIISATEISEKLEIIYSRETFGTYINNLFEDEISKLKTRKKRFFDYESKEWKDFDGSLEAKRKIFLSQYSRYPEFEAKQRIVIKLIRDIENQIRVEKGFTVVGTLINESILYTKIKKYFSNYKVISQHRPKWLGRQSLDIYIEEIRIAIEYQGDQHTRPIDFFGGEESFLKTQERDRRKIELCKRNGCRLIYVYPNYSFEDVLNEIQKNINTNK